MDFIGIVMVAIGVAVIGGMWLLSWLTETKPGGIVLAGLAAYAAAVLMIKGVAANKANLIIPAVTFAVIAAVMFWHNLSRRPR